MLGNPSRRALMDVARAAALYSTRCLSPPRSFPARPSQKVQTLLDAIPRHQPVAVGHQCIGGGRLTGQGLRLGHRRGDHLARGHAAGRVRRKFRAQRHSRQGAADAGPARPEGPGRGEGGPRETDITSNQGSGRCLEDA